MAPPARDDEKLVDYEASPEHNNMEVCERENFPTAIGGNSRVPRTLELGRYALLRRTKPKGTCVVR